MSTERLFEPTVGQHYFTLDARGGFVPVQEPLPAKKDGFPLSWKEVVRLNGQEIPPVPEDLADLADLLPNSQQTLKARYLAKNEKGEIIETPREMLWRVAYNVAMAEEFYGGDPDKTARKFYEMMVNLEFLPNSPTLMNAGRDLQQLSACFVLPVGDSIDSIFKTIWDTAKIHQSGGGTGFSFSKIRPEGSRVRRSGGVASGPLSFMRVYDSATEQIKQGGKRRGANMAILEVSHPDIEKFIEAKVEAGEFENFNFSVAASDAFMEAVKTDGEFEEVNPHTRERKQVKARPIFDKIVQRAWASAEPGIVFLDRINQTNPTAHLGRIESTNPCGEQPLHPYESCNLGSINLDKMVKDGRIDWERLESVVKTSVHFLDNVIDMNNYPLPEIEEMTLGNRRIGLGVMGFAGMLVQLGIPYDSELGLETAEKAMKFIQETTYKASEELAEIRGVFPNWEGSLHQKNGRRMRNATVTTIAPTGTISIIAGVSSGCEPFFALYFERKGLLDGKTTLSELNPHFEKMAQQEGLDQQMIEEIKNKGTLRQLPVSERLKKLFGTAHEIDPEWHVRMQAAFQKNTDNAVSKTINLPEEATVEDVKTAYLLAYKLGCKGVTVYRNFSREAQVLYVGEAGSPSVEQQPVKLARRERPRVKDGKSIEQQTQWGKLFATLNVDDGGYPLELFNTLGRGGSDLAADTEAISRLVSGFLQHVPKEYSWQVLEIVVDQLRGIKGGTEPTPLSPDKIYSLPDGIAKALRSLIEAYKSGNLNEIILDSSPLKPENPALEVNTRNSCPECHEHTLIFQEGCWICSSCLFSKCG